MVWTATLALSQVPCVCHEQSCEVSPTTDKLEEKLTEDNLANHVTVRPSSLAWTLPSGQTTMGRELCFPKQIDLLRHTELLPNILHYIRVEPPLTWMYPIPGQSSCSLIDRGSDQVRNIVSEPQQALQLCALLMIQIEER